MFVVRFARAVRNNPKKSVAAAVVLAWTGRWAEKKYTAHIFRRVECQNAAKLGRETLNQFNDPRRLTVLLNPAANDGKAGQMYEKYAAPILHLAGVDVHLVKLSYEGEAKRLMSVIENTDVIVCAGGDGTLSEIVTGLLRRPDKNWKKIPVGVIPLGKSNTMCRRLLPDADHERQPHFVCSAASAITNSALTPVDVMKIDGSAGKTVFAVSSIRWGTYRDLQARAKKFWYFGRLRSYVPFSFSLFKEDPFKPRLFSISYTDPDDVPPPQESNTNLSNQPTISATSILSKIVYYFWPWKSLDSRVQAIEEELEVESQDPEWCEIQKRSIEFFAQANTHLNSEGRQKASIKVTLESDTVLYKDFISRGPHTVRNMKHSPVQLSADFEADSIKLSSQLNEDDKQYISIDNDNYEAMDITVKLLPNCINMIRSPKV